MPELRVDPLTGARTILAGDRAGRPGGAPTVVAAEPIDVERDPFAEGHEDRTPPELFALRPAGTAPDTPGWRVRVVPNLYPALDGASRTGAGDAGVDDPAAPLAPAAPGPGANASRDLFLSGPAVGGHEVIVNHPRAVVSLAELTLDDVAAAVGVWRQRMRVHAGAACVHVIVNERREAGASLPHTHAQLYALPFVPADLARERERFGAYATRTMGGNLLADLLQEEVRRRDRVVAIDSEAVLLTPYASRVPYQLQLVPRIPRARFEDDGPDGARMLHEALSRLGRRLGAQPPLNLWVRTAPQGADHYCWRIDIVPRLTHLAGLELGAGVNLNIVGPERAAAELREV